MNPIDFLKTIYLGDRGCTKIVIDNDHSIIKFQIDLISRIRSQSGYWEYYQDENLEEGCIVISSIESFTMNSKGLLPNDCIKSLEAKKIEGRDVWEFTFKINAVAKNLPLRSEEVEIIVVAESIHLEKKDGIKMTG